MGNVLALRPDVDAALTQAREKSRSMTRQSEWTQLRADQREVAFARMAVLQPIVELIHEGHSQRAAILHVLSCVEAGMIPEGYGLAIQAIRSELNRSTLQRWISDYIERGILGLVPQWKGRQRKESGWEALLVQMLRRPPRRHVTDYAYDLREMGHTDATDRRVRSYIASLPANQREFSSALVGAHYRRQNLTPHVRRNRDSVPPGFLYEGDGHRLDWYTAHHNNGSKHLYELTWWIDIGSYFIVGWWLSASESAATTHYSLGHAITKHDHVPAVIHVDPGPGFKNKLMRDEIAGLAPRIGFQMDIALPGNARGKGNVEGSFHHLEDKCGKKFETFLGKGMPQELIRTMDKRIATGELQLPTFAQTYDAIAAYVERSNNNARDFLGGRTPAEVFATREANPLYLPPDVLAKPAERCKVNKYEVRLFNRWYRHAALSAYQGEELMVQYDLHDDHQVTVRTPEGRWICDAQLVHKKNWYSQSRMQDIQTNSLNAAIRRKQSQIDELQDKANRVINAAPYMLPAVCADEYVQLPPPEPAPISDAAAALLEEHIAAEQSAVPDSAEARFALWQEMKTRSDLDGTERAWVEQYATTSECRGRLMVLEDLGDSNLTTGRVAAL